MYKFEAEPQARLATEIVHLGLVKAPPNNGGTMEHLD